MKMIAHTSHRHPDQAIVSLAMIFMTTTDDRKKKTQIEYLGFHPINHARFVQELIQVGLFQDLQAYYELTKWMD